MKDPEWFWGLGNPQDYWYKGELFNNTILIKWYIIRLNKHNCPYYLTQI